MKATKFAELKNEQLDEIKRLEEKLDVTLIAYNLLAPEINTHNRNNNDVINPS